jgi:hypothetical protein
VCPSPAEGQGHTLALGAMFAQRRGGRVGPVKTPKRAIAHPGPKAINQKLETRNKIS